MPHTQLMIPHKLKVKIYKYVRYVYVVNVVLFAETSIGQALADLGAVFHQRPPPADRFFLQRMWQKYKVAPSLLKTLDLALNRNDYLPIHV